MNWGYRLTLLFIGFAALMFTLVYKATHTRYELVSKDYYSEELRYQDKIDGMNNAAEAGDIVLSRQDHTLQIVLPDTLRNLSDTAEAWFYCKTEAASDRKLMTRFSSGEATIDIGNFPAASYEMRLQFSSGQKKYYYTKALDLR
jgi:hypothetical protein